MRQHPNVLLLACMAFFSVSACVTVPRFESKGAKQARRTHRAFAVLPCRVSYGSVAPQTATDSALRRQQRTAQSELLQTTVCLRLQQFLFTAKAQGFGTTNVRLRQAGLSTAEIADGLGAAELADLPETLGVDATLYLHVHLRGDAAEWAEGGRPKSRFGTDFSDFDFEAKLIDATGRPFWQYAWRDVQDFGQALDLLAYKLPYRPNRKQRKRYLKDGVAPYEETGNDR